MTSQQILSIVLAGLLAVCAGLLIGQGEDAQLTITAVQEQVTALEAKVAQTRTPRIEVENASIWTTQGELVVVKEGE